MRAHPLTSILRKVNDHTEITGIIEKWKNDGQKVVFTNGCFDIIHPGHIHLLCEAKSFGDKLIVALNSDDSVRRLKGNNRPINNKETRALQIAALQMVDGVTFFEEDTPQQIIEMLMPDILVKGGDYKPNEVVGKGIVEANGGEVKIVRFKEGFSTTALLEKLRK